MGYVLSYGEYYCQITETNAIKKTTDLDLATRFATPQAACNMKDRACKKLKNFHVLDLDTNKYVAVTTKRRSINGNKRDQVYEKSMGRCEICGKHLTIDDFTVDHIVPLAKGGTNSIENLQCTCDICNRLKQDILPEDLLKKMMEIILYQIEKNNGEEVLKEVLKTAIKKFTRFEVFKMIMK